MSDPTSRGESLAPASPQVARDPANLRILAAFLAAGGTVWGVLLLPIVLRTGTPTLSQVALLGPGYLVTVGYFVRCLSRPSPRWARGIWGVSALVQGAWLATFVWSVIPRGEPKAPPDLFALITGGWWALSFVASVYGLFAEPRPRPA